MPRKLKTRGKVRRNKARTVKPSGGRRASRRVGRRVRRKTRKVMIGGGSHAINLIGVIQNVVHLLRRLKFKAEVQEQVQWIQTQCDNGTEFGKLITFYIKKIKKREPKVSDERAIQIILTDLDNVSLLKNQVRLRILNPNHLNLKSINDLRSDLEKAFTKYADNKYDNNNRSSSESAGERRGEIEEANANERQRMQNEVQRMQNEVERMQSEVKTEPEIFQDAIHAAVADEHALGLEIEANVNSGKSVTEQQKADVVKWYKKAAIDAAIEARTPLGLHIQAHLQSGKIVPKQQTAEVVEWYKKVAAS